MGEVSDGHDGGGVEGDGLVGVGMNDVMRLKVSSFLIKEIGRTFSDLQ